MFGRLKQKVKEKTGRASITPMPADVQEIMDDFAKWADRDKQVIKAFQESTELWKKNKKSDVISELKDLRGLESSIGKSADNLAQLLSRKAANEVLASEKMRTDLDNRLKAFISGELHNVQQSISALKARRLDRDASEAEFSKNESQEKKQKFDIALREFDIALDRVRTAGSRQEEFEKLHIDYLKDALRDYQAGFSTEE
ncbi:unnamed protein product [Caenorhabditis auriculariae]|uniref:BAR domain-containing protein n=1 Tax=Caenorhabditis auriculariae TaxID=2777116 RepID=A0A8S1HJ82_9PELO|nr:unnamed protein product [Caenorhabditis auriculariae]